MLSTTEPTRPDTTTAELGSADASAYKQQNQQVQKRKAAVEPSTTAGSASR